MIDDAVAYVKSFRYVDDLRYAKTYIESRKEREAADRWKRI